MHAFKSDDEQFEAQRDPSAGEGSLNDPCEKAEAEETESVQAKLASEAARSAKEASTSIVVSAAGDSASIGVGTKQAGSVAKGIMAGGGREFEEEAKASFTITPSKGAVKIVQRSLRERRPRCRGATLSMNERSGGDEGVDKGLKAKVFEGADDVDREAISGAVESKAVLKLWAKEVCSEVERQIKTTKNQTGLSCKDGKASQAFGSTVEALRVLGRNVTSELLVDEGVFENAFPVKRACTKLARSSSEREQGQQVEDNPNNMGIRVAQKLETAAVNPICMDFHSSNSFSPPGLSSVRWSSERQASGEPFEGRVPREKQNFVDVKNGTKFQGRPSSVKREAESFVQSAGGEISVDEAIDGDAADPDLDSNVLGEQHLFNEHVAGPIGPIIFDMAVHDSAQRFDLSDGDTNIDLPQLSFMQAAELGREGRRDFTEGAFPSMKRTLNFDDSDGDDFNFGLTQDVGQYVFDEGSAPPESNTGKFVKRRIVGKTAASEKVGFPTQPQVTKTE